MAEYNYEDNPICPHCDHEHSRDFCDESGKYTCDECGEDFNVSVYVEVTYSTSPVSCGRGKHTYEFKEKWLRNQKSTTHKGKLVFIDLPEEEHKHFRIMECSKCGEKEYVQISKTEYDDID
jgi:hypothetical protein